MTSNIIPVFKPASPVASGFNPFGLTEDDVGYEYGWRLLDEGEPLREGDGYYHPDYELHWICYLCRPQLLRRKEVVHTWPWRRKINETKSANP